MVYLMCILVGIGLGDVLKVERQILLPDGKPAAQARVLVRTFGRQGQPVRETWLTTNADGVFAGQVDLESPQSPGERWGYLMVDTPGCALTFAELPTMPHFDNSPLRLTPAYTHTVSVMDQGLKQPLEGARVFISGFTDGKIGGWAVNVPNLGLTTEQLVGVSGKDGSLTFRGVDIERASFVRAGLIATAESSQGLMRGTAEPTFRSTGSPAPAKPDQPTVIWLNPSTSVRGKVVDAVTGKPVQGASIKLVSDPGIAAATMKRESSNDQGEFEFKDAPSALLLLVEVTHSSYGITWSRIGEERRAIGPIQQSGILTLSLRPWTEVAGKVVEEESGTPALTPIEVGSVYEVGYDNGGVRCGRGHSDVVALSSDGRFRLRLPVGSNRLWALGKGYRCFLDLEAKANQTEEVEMKLRKVPGCLIRLTGNPETMKKCFIYIKMKYGREGSAGSYPQIADGYWFWPASNWGEKLQLRIETNQKAEVLPWTELVADAAQWPFVVEVK